MRMLVALMLALFASPLRGEVTPQAGPGDPHIQTVAYDPQQVVALHVAAGFALTLAFAAEERIATVTLGEGQGWSVQATHAADRLVIRPNGVAPTTNLTVFTDARAYNFTLYGAVPGEGVQPYLISFTYPAPDRPVPVEEAPGRYTLHGDRRLWPVAIGDKAGQTSLRWAADQPLPAVYRKDAQGHTALVNSRMREGALMVEGVHEELLFVLDGRRASARRHTAQEAR